MKNNRTEIEFEGTDIEIDAAVPKPLLDDTKARLAAVLPAYKDITLKTKKDNL